MTMKHHLFFALMVGGLAAGCAADRAIKKTRRSTQSQPNNAESGAVSAKDGSEAVSDKDGSGAVSDKDGSGAVSDKDGSGAVSGSNGRNGQNADPGAAVDSRLDLVKLDTVDDAFGYTVGVLKLGVKFMAKEGTVAADKETDAAPLEPTVFTLLRKVDKSAFDVESLAEKDLNLVKDVCANFAVSTEEHFNDNASMKNSANRGIGEIWLAWRPALRVQTKIDLSHFLLDKGAEILCGVEFKFAPFTAQGFTVAFDPIPQKPKDQMLSQAYLGTVKLDEAVKSTITLPLAKDYAQKILSEKWAKVVGKSQLTFTRQVKALRAAAPTSSLSPPTDACSYHGRSKDSLAADRPDQQLKGTFTVKLDELDYKIDKLYATGKNSSAPTKICESVAAKINDDNHSGQMQLTCNIALILNDEANCALAATLINNKDPMDEYMVRSPLPAFKVKINQPIDYFDVIKALPVSPNNPISGTNKRTTFSGFNSQQMAALSDALNFWIALDSPDFTTYFLNKITNVQSSNTESCVAGAQAYVASDSPSTIFWCLEGTMSSDVLNNASNSAYNTLNRSGTFFHETLHANGRPHDFQDKSIPPCTNGGTAYAAVIAVKTYECKEYYCFAMKNLAQSEFKFQLNYSLKDDPRRFQGQCDQWAKELGVSF